MMTVVDDKVTAVDLSKVVMVKSNNPKKTKGVLSSQDLAFQEARRQRRVRRIDFEERLGEVVEWFMALVLKTSLSARATWVRIPPSPFIEV